MKKSTLHSTNFSRLLCVALVAAMAFPFLLTGCSSKGTMVNNMAADSVVSSANQEMKSDRPAAAEEVMAMDTLASDPLTANQVLANKNVKLIWYADVSMETLDFDSLVNQVAQTVGEYEGYVESSSVSGGTRLNGMAERRYADYAIRIPADRLNDFLIQVGTLGNITYKNLRSEDITLEYADNEARKATLQLEEKKLMELLEQATNLADIIQLESRLSEIHYQLDGLSSTLRKYDDLVDYSTVYLSLHEVNKITESPKTLGERISSGFADSLYSLQVFAEDTIVFIVARSPILLLLGVILVLACLLLKKLNKRNKEKVAQYNEKRRASMEKREEERKNNNQEK